VVVNIDSKARRGDWEIEPASCNTQEFWVLEGWELRGLVLSGRSHSASLRACVARRFLRLGRLGGAPQEPQALGGACPGNWALNEDEVHMKNTGKRIFFVVVMFVVANAVLLVSAGAFTSQR